MPSPLPLPLSSRRAVVPRRSFWTAPARRTLPLAIAALFCQPALAEISDTIHPFVAANYFYDDNLLRLADNQSIDGARSDHYSEVDAGLLFERPVGRQMFNAQLKVSKVNFDRFSQLDYTGKDFTGVWNWQLGNHWSGHLGGLYSETLAPFSDFHTEQRNVRTHSREYVDANYLFHPRWQVHAAYSNEKFSYDLASQSYSNRTETAAEFGGDYLAPSGSKVGLVFRHLDGKYPDGTLGGVLVHDNYTQDEAKASIVWIYSGVTQVSFLGGYVRRQHDVFTQRDDSGVNARLTAYWQPLGKVKFTGAAWREFAAVDGTFINSSLNSGISLDTAYAATGKISVDLLLRHEKRAFQPAQGAGSVFDGLGLDDKSDTAQLGVTYLWRPNLQLNLNASHDKRSGSVAAGTNQYKSNSVSFGLRAQF